MVTIYTVPFRPYMYSAISVGLPALLLTFPYFFSQRKIPCRYIHSRYIPVIPSSGHMKEPAHFTDSVFICMTVDHHIFYACSHFLSVSERKTRSNSFSISIAFICRSFIASSYLNCVILLNCCTDGGSAVPSFRGLPLVQISIPSASLCCFLLYQVLKFLISLYVKPNLSPVSLRLWPCSIYSISSFS